MLIKNQIILGDSLEVMRNIAQNSVDLIITDIPYGINYKSNKQNYDTRGKTSFIKDRPEYFETIEGDSELPVNWLLDAYRVMKQNSAMYVFCHWSTFHSLIPPVQKAGFKYKNMIILNKSNHGMGDLKGQYAPKHELLLFVTKDRHILKFPDKRMNDVWDVKVKYSGAKRFHPNEKPLQWIEPAICNSSNEGDLVLDPFCGSGTTGLAAKNLNRKYCLIDIDQKYIDICFDRLHS